MRYLALLAVTSIAALAAAGTASASPHAKNGLISFYAVTPDEGAELFATVDLVDPDSTDRVSLTSGILGGL